MDLFIQLAMAAADQAMRYSKLRITEENADDVGVLIGVGRGGLNTIRESHQMFCDSRLQRLTPFFTPKVIANLAPGHISIKYGARGANMATTSACASSSHTLGQAYRMIRDGYLDAAITGGTQATLTPLSVGGFAMHALSTATKIIRPPTVPSTGIAMAS